MTLYWFRASQFRRLATQGHNRMTKAPPSPNRPKGGTKSARSSGGPNGGDPAKKEAVSRTGKATTPGKAELTSAARMLRDIKQTAADLSARADRLLRRVS